MRGKPRLLTMIDIELSLYCDAVLDDTAWNWCLPLHSTRLSGLMQHARTQPASTFSSVMPE
jgi:hypothetical protein